MEMLPQKQLRLKSIEKTKHQEGIGDDHIIVGVVLRDITTTEKDGKIVIFGLTEDFLMVGKKNGIVPISTLLLLLNYLKIIGEKMKNLFLANLLVNTIVLYTNNNLNYRVGVKVSVHTSC